MLLEVHNMDIQLCCFLAAIYVCVHLFGCQNKSACFQKFKPSNVFYAHARIIVYAFSISMAIHFQSSTVALAN